MTEHTSQDPAPRIALVLGASRGLGAAMAEALGTAGWQVVAVARTTGALEELDDRIRRAGGPAATLAPMDITRDDAMRTLCRGIHDRWGRADLWVHAAVHAPPLSPAGHIAAKDWDRSVAINVRATGVLIPMIEPLLKAAPAGTALFFDDAQGSNRFHGAYGATKAAQVALARHWQGETARLGPRVLIETPPPMPTAVRARFRPGEDHGRLTPCAQVAAGIMAALGQGAAGQVTG
ncbi:SDR family NAD(P)-dependent oxidoreductase [Rhodobaculum claviforme]|uniref:Oxidoreductase n=1 Tax=Rhodobaculum claviforme TaxID=1549854 RepID=A0A934TID1_9RHOB|nr:SDR family oxidoreductase [Rhodobaculum claviforme]MBK5926051.1 oxidoreductase [Rhodobaculum claviforme]